MSETIGKFEFTKTVSRTLGLNKSKSKSDDIENRQLASSDESTRKRTNTGKMFEAMKDIKREGNFYFN